jgi:hypothetical protein
MGKHLTLQVDQIVTKTNGELFGGHGGNPFPTLTIKKITPWSVGKYLLNGLYVIDQEKLTVIDEAEQLRIEETWKNLEISEVLKPDLNTSCIREDNGEAKVKFSENSYKKALFKFRIRNPEGNYEAYKCAQCGSIHIGKTV